MAKVDKMDKIRRTTINRYGQDKADAVLELLSDVLDDYIPAIMATGHGANPDMVINTDNLALAQQALADIVKRMKIGPQTIIRDTKEDADNE